MKVDLSLIPETSRLTQASVARLENLSRAGVGKRIDRDREGRPPRRQFTWADTPCGVVIDARSLSPEGQKRWEAAALRGGPLPSPSYVTQLSNANGGPHGPSLPALAGRSSVTPLLQPSTPPHGPSLKGQASLFVPDEIRALGLPSIDQQQVVSRRLQMVELSQNGAWAKSGAANKTEFLEKLAAENEISVRSLFRFIRNYRREGVAGLVPDARGPKGGPRDLEVWMRALIERNYRGGLSGPANYRELRKEIAVRQDTERWRVGHLYPVPSPYQVSRFLRRLSPINETARKGGVEALKAAAGYLDRRIDEHAGDCWCIDEWKVDAHLYLDWEVPTVIRPYVFTIIDERSKAILAWKIVVDLSGTAVVDLTAECARRHGLPLRWYSDRGGHFRGKMGRHYRELPKEEVLGPAAGMLERLGVLHQGPREKNPRANRVERLHRVYAQKALETLGGSSCGRDAKMAEALGVHARIEEHKQLCTKPVNVLEETRLLSFRQFEAIFPKWVEQYNSTPSKANGLHGLAPIAAFKTFSPDSAELASRQVSEEALAVASADYFSRKIRLGGIIEIAEDRGRVTLYYSAPELAPHAGEDRNCFRLRHNDTFLVVEPREPRGDRVIAERRVRVGIGDEAGMAKAIEQRKRIEKFLIEQYAPQRDVVADVPPTRPVPTASPDDFVMVHGIPVACEPAADLEPVHSTLSRRELYNAGRAKPAVLEPVQQPEEKIEISFYRG